MSLNTDWELSSLSTQYCVHMKAMADIHQLTPVEISLILSCLNFLSYPGLSSILETSQCMWYSGRAMHYIKRCFDLVLDLGSPFSMSRKATEDFPQQQPPSWGASITDAFLKSLVQFTSFCLGCWAPRVWVWIGLTVQRKWEDLQN